MASIQEQVTSETWELILRFLGTGAELVYNVTHEGGIILRNGGDFAKEMLVTLINENKKKAIDNNVVSKMLARANKGEGLNNMLVAEEEVDSLKKYFEKQPMPFIVLDNNTDDSKIFLYMSGDSQKAINAVTLWQADKGLISEINPNLFIDDYSADEIGTVSGLNDVDLFLFRQYAIENNLVFSSIEIENKENLLLYKPSERKNVERVLGATIWATTYGDEGALIRKQISYKLQNRQAINISLLDAQREFYIVNGEVPENYIHVTANDFAYYKNSKEILRIDRSSAGFMDKAWRTIDGLSQPTLLNKEEFELVKEDGNLDREAIAQVVIQKNSSFLNDNKINELMNKQNEERALIEMKMSLDNENQGAFWIFDDSISFGASGSFEAIDDMDDAAKINLQKIKDESKKFFFTEMQNDKNIDYYIAEAEKRRKVPEPVQEHEFERQY